MAWTVDARVPVVFGAAGDAGPEDAVLLEDGAGEAPAGVAALAGFGVAAAVHAADCACCVPRSGAAQALAGLFQARAKGEVGFFRRVVVVAHSAEGDAAVWAAVRGDPLVSGRFRLG